jgi:dTDP-4-dehydrorhamnose reductase
MRVIVFGANGLLGNSLMRTWQSDELTGLTREDADIRDPEQVQNCFRRCKPDWAVLSAAYTDVDGCEANPALAFAVNSQGAANVALAARDHHARLLLVSTDYVFDGLKNTPYEASDARAPRSIYGKSKAEAEAKVGEILPQCCIVRTSWLFGVGGRCFPDTILRLASVRPEIAVVTDQRGCPTYNDDLASAIARLCRVQASGIIHATNAGECTWFDFASEIVNARGLKTLIRPTNSNEFKRPAERPHYSVLSPASLHAYEITLPAWQDALRRYIAARSIAG